MSLSLLKYAGIGLAAFLLGAGAYAFFSPDETSLIDQVHLDSSEYTFINPLLYVRTSKDTSAEYDVLHDAFANRIATHVSAGRATRVSVYFRDLTSSHWTGVGEDDSYTPSSLLKVALIMGVFNIASEDPKILEKRVLYDPKDNDAEMQHYQPDAVRQKGYYRIRDLIEMTVKDSDNAASVALGRPFNREFESLYSSFQLPELPKDYLDFMSPRAYSTLFRALYNATYLSDTDSEYVLSLLSATKFEHGLVKGVPEGIRISHKFGENTILNQDGSVAGHELHDCGIVYIPSKPYFLCIMTEGKEFDGLEEVISDLSTTAYEHRGQTSRLE